MPGLGRSPREWNSYSLLYSGLENSMDCIVLGVAKSQTWQFSVQHGCVILSIGIFAWTVLHRVSFPDFMCRLPCPEDKKRCLLYLRAENYHPPSSVPAVFPSSLTTQHWVTSLCLQDQFFNLQGQRQNESSGLLAES